MKKLTILLLSIIILAGCQKNVAVETSPETPVEEKKVQSDTIEIVKFFDYLCPYCQTGNDTMKNLRAKYGDKVHITFQHFPVHRGAFQIASASECARDQNNFQEYKDLYFKDFFGKTSEEDLTAIATQLELNMDDFEACLSSDIKRSVIEQHMQNAQRFQVRAVPYFIVGDQILQGAYPQPVFEKLIEAQLNGE